MNTRTLLCVIVILSVVSFKAIADDEQTDLDSAIQDIIDDPDLTAYDFSFNGVRYLGFSTDNGHTINDTEMYDEVSGVLLNFHTTVYSYQQWNFKRINLTQNWCPNFQVCSDEFIQDPNQMSGSF